jgi:hypothetical protein
MERHAFGRFDPTPTVPQAHALLDTGRVMVTVSSRETHRHVTLSFRCSRLTDERWPTVPWSEASHVFVDDFDGAPIATYEPPTGFIRFSATSSEAEQWTVGALLRYMAGYFPKLLDRAYVDTPEVGVLEFA